MSEKIIELIKGNDGFCSGARMSAELGISRTAVWKKIIILRKKGFVIEAVPSRGYRLISVPELSADYIRAGVSGTVWNGILVYDRVSSTNELAMSLAAKDWEGPNAVIIADCQEKGKGRLGRIWLSPAGKNIYMSLMMRPNLETRDATMLTLLSAVASATAIRKVSGLPVTIKWPNDLILSGKKLGGILTEIRADIDRVSLAVVGIGINVNTDKKDFTGGIDTIATSIKEEAGKRFSRNELIIETLKEFDRLYRLFNKQGKLPLLKEWKDLSSTIGRKVQVSMGDEILIGIAEDVDESGMLILKLQSGVLKRISSGDVTLLG
jgi:BirA family transcriptional regulator, biotin operon repressor / biotin---[acetyl-CoA-carboxylase] ligase